MKRHPKRRFCCRSIKRFNTCACTDMSRADTISSQINNLGFKAMALPIEIRCCCPPEN
ncbi:hypothetical protein CLAVI_000340 [Candidatus Clavichlamydia salmonicola]|nr:hypothetical protein [Candidatus Clavichlamydia salmonicola]